jgi:hypothetical protein
MRDMPAVMMHGGGGVLFMMTTKFASQQTKNQETHEFQNKCDQSPLSLTTMSTPKQQTQHHHKQKQQWQQTPCSIKQTYRRDSVLPNEKDGPKMTTAQCNPPRR